MTFRVRLLEVVDGELRVVLQGVELLVAYQLLHDPPVWTAADEFGRARAADRVRRDRDRQREPITLTTDALQERVLRQPSSRWEPRTERCTCR